LEKVKRREEARGVDPVPRVPRKPHKCHRKDPNGNWGGGEKKDRQKRGIQKGIQMRNIRAGGITGGKKGWGGRRKVNTFD